MAPRSNLNPKPETDLICIGGSVFVTAAAREEARELLRSARQLALQASLRFAPSEKTTSNTSTSLADTVTKCRPLAFIGSVSRIANASTNAQVCQRMKTTTASEWMTVRQVSEEAGVHIRTAETWVKKGKLPASKTATGRIQIKRKDFLRFMGRDR